MKRLLMFGPIGDFGGRELESGFIAKTLSDKYYVDICTTASFSMNSQVFEFNSKQSMFSLNQLLYNKYFAFKSLSVLSFIKNGRKGEKYDYVNNYLLKEYFDFDRKINSILETLVSEYDAVFICAQLCSGYVDRVMFYAKKHNLKIFFRTTGYIESSNYNFIKDVDCFIHHSLDNANRIERNIKHNFVIIDQFANDENSLLQIPIDNQKKYRYGFLGRLSHEKGIIKIMKYLINKNEILLIAGKGSQQNEVINLVEKNDNFYFLGEIEPQHLHDFFKEIDVLIIPSLEEAGPLVALEAMAAGKILFSTKVGAMLERLDEKSYPFWFDIHNIESLDKCFVQLTNMGINEISILRNNLRKTYTDNYSQNKIAYKYLNIVSKYLN